MDTKNSIAPQGAEANTDISLPKPAAQISADLRSQIAAHRAQREADIAARNQAFRDDFVRGSRLRLGSDPDATLRRLQAEATAAADAPLGSSGTAIARVMPAIARAAGGLAIPNPKLWEADAKPLRGRTLDSAPWLAAVRRAARAREKGDVLEATIVRLAELLVWAVRSSGAGFARLTFEGMARLPGLGCVRETARKAIRWLEARGLLDTFNVLSRDHGMVRRAANLYLIPDLAHTAETPIGASLVERLNRYAAAFGLTARAWGLNATPAPLGHRPTWRRPPPD